MKISEMTDADKGKNPLHLGAIGWIPGFGSIRNWIPDHFWLRQPKIKAQVHLTVAEVCALRMLFSIIYHTKNVYIQQ